MWRGAEEGCEGSAEVFDLSVLEGGHPYVAGCCDVGGGVVDEEAAVDRSADPFGGQEVDARVRLHDPDAGGVDHGVGEAVGAGPVPKYAVMSRSTAS